MSEIGARGKREHFVGKLVVPGPDQAPIAAVILNGRLTDPTNRALLDDELAIFEGGAVVVIPVDRWTPISSVGTEKGT